MPEEVPRSHGQFLNVTDNPILFRGDLTGRLRSGAAADNKQVPRIAGVSALFFQTDAERLDDHINSDNQRRTKDRCKSRTPANENAAKIISKR